MKNNLITTFALIIILALTNNCSKLNPTSAKDNPTNALERARKNVNEGKGISLKNIVGGRDNNFEFSTSNPMWRASLEVLDFLPLTVVDYAGGIIVSDWYGDQTEDSIKITIRFLSNEIRTDSIKITVHEKKCSLEKKCTINIKNSKIQQELISSILNKAAILQKNTKIK